jgi:hypothetical protein
VGETVWHSGFEVTVDTATIETEETGVFTEETTYYATLEMTIENLGEDTWTFSPEMALTSGGDTHTQQTFDNDIPEVPGGLSSEGTVTFVVDEEFSLDDATLIVGSGDEQRAFVPLGPEGDDLVALEPQPQAIAGQIAMELITLDFTDGETRADFPRFHSEQDDGSLVLNLNFTATSRTSGNWNIFDADFALTKPDGTSVTVDSSTLGSIPGSDAGITTPDLSITFDVDDPAAGEYTLIFTPGSWFVADGGATEGQFVFTVE